MVVVFPSCLFADSDDPHGRAVPIPGNKGMDFFRDTWVRVVGRDFVEGNMTISADQIVYEHHYPREMYAVVGESEKFVILLVTFWDDYAKTQDFFFYQLSWSKVRYGHRMRIRSCGTREKYVLSDLKLSRDELWRRFQEDTLCGPKSAKPTNDGEFSIGSNTSILYSQAGPADWDKSVIMTKPLPK